MTIGLTEPERVMLLASTPTMMSTTPSLLTSPAPLTAPPQCAEVMVPNHWNRGAALKPENTVAWPARLTIADACGSPMM